MGLTRIRAEQISDIDYKQAVRVIETTNVTLSGGAPSTVDGVTLVAGDRILVAGQSTGSQNGLYDVSVAGTGSNGTWVRTNDANTTGEINAGMIVMVTEGTNYADTSWKLVTNDPITIGSTSLLFLQNTGNSFNVIVANSTSIAANGVSSSISFTSDNNLVITGNAAADIINFAVSASPSFSGNVIAGNVSTAGNVQASYVLGNGSQLTGLPAGYANSNAAAYFASGTSSSNIAITGDILTTAYISATGNITGNVFVGNGAALTNLNGANVTGIVAQATQANYANTANAVSGSNVSGAVANATVATYANTANAVSGSNVSGQVGNALIAGTVYANAQPNITSVGTLTSLSVSGNIIGGNISVVGVTVDTGNVTAGNILTGGLVSAQGNLTAGNLLINTNATILGNLSVAGTVTFSNSSVIVTNDLYIELANNQSTYTGINGAGLQAGNTGTGTLTNWTYASTPNAWSTNVGISAAGSVFGNTFYGNGAGLTSLTGANVTGTVPAASIAATVTTNAQPNITSTGTLTAVTVTGNTQSGNLLTAGYISATGNIQGNVFIGNGAGLTNINAANLIGAYSNANVANYLPTYSGNLTVNNISAIGNLTVGNLAITGNSLTTAVANGNLTITTQGTGALNLHSEFIEMYTINNTLPSFQIANTGDVRIYAPSFNSAVGALAVVGSPDGNTIPPQNQGVMLHTTGVAGTPTRIYNDGANTYSAFVGRRYNGTADAPTQVLANSIVSRYSATPYSNTGWPAISTARIDMVTTEDQTSTNGGTEIQFWTTSLGSTTVEKVMSLTNNDINLAGNITAIGNLTMSTNPAYVNIITVSGASYDAQVVIDDVGTDHVAQLILNRSSTSVQPILASALNNSDDPTANVDVSNGQTLFQITSLGFAGTDYKEFSSITFYADDNGTISDTSSPGKITFDVTPDGSTNTNSALIIYNDATAKFTANVSVTGIVSITSNLGNANIAAQIITADDSYINTNQPGVMIHITGQTVNPTRLYIDGAGSNNYAAYIGRHYNGTPTSPSQVLANTVVSRFGANPYGVSGFAPISTTRIDMMTVEDQTSTNKGSQILLAATPLGSNVIANVAVFNGTGLSVVGNVRASTAISAAGNITGSYILGNGAFLSGVITSVANINNGTSNISVYNSGNITVGVSSVGNTVVFTPTQTDFNTAISVAGNITGNYLFGNGSQLTGISSTGTVVGGNLLILTRFSGTIDATIVAGYVIVLARSGNINMPVSN
jgi:hypothetical protein